MIMCASDDLYSSLQRDMHSIDQDEDVDPAPYEHFRIKSKLRFYTWIMMSTHTRKKLVRQRHLMSFVTHFHGLTRSGLDILHRAGLCSSRSSFNRWWQCALETQDQNTR